MSPRRARRFGLVGTITKDFITSDSTAGPRKEKGPVHGTVHRTIPKNVLGSVPGALPGRGRAACIGLGGVLYQAAVLCGLNEDVILHTNVGRGLQDEVRAVVGGWPTLRTSGLRPFPGPGNRVRLHYPDRGERREVLESAVPALDPAPILHDLPRLDFLIMVINSGFDIAVGDWRQIVRAARCPAWLDIHSLVLTKVLNAERRYRALPEWREWAEGVAYLQANRKEVACMLGRPDEAEDWPSADSGEMLRFADTAFEIGVRAVLLTLGKGGALVMTPAVRRIIPSPPVGRLVDTTGCGDVFCSATAMKLVRGEDPFEAAAYGVALASRAASVSGVLETYELARSEMKAP